MEGKDEAEEAVDGFEPLPDEQQQPAEALSQSHAKPSYAFVAVLTTLLLAYTDQSLTGGNMVPTEKHLTSCLLRMTTLYCSRRRCVCDRCALRTRLHCTLHKLSPCVCTVLQRACQRSMHASLLCVHLCAVLGANASCSQVGTCQRHSACLS